MKNIEQEIKDCELEKCLRAVDIYRTHYEYERGRSKKLEYTALLLSLVVVVLVVALMECLYFNI